MITTELLEAFLSPDPSRRRQAEAYWKSLEVGPRAQALLQGLQQHQQPAHLQHLQAVLLRRDILLCTQPQDFVPALLDLLAERTTTSSTTAKAVGDCLAQVCGVLQWIAPEQGVATMQQILQAIAPAVSKTY